MKKTAILIVATFFVITCLFFYPVFKGEIPFPGDLLVSTPPYNTNSYLGYAPGGVPNKAQDADVMHQFFPWKYFVINSIKHFQIPFWTPFDFSGTPLMANFQSGVFYPGNAVFLVLPFFWAWSVYIFLAPFLAGIFLYLFLRESSLSRPASVFGGVIFAFSSYMVVWIEYGNITHTFMWLPLLLYVTKKYITKPAYRYLIFIICIQCLAFLAGYIQGFFYASVVVALYYLMQVNILYGKKLNSTIWYTLAFISPVFLCLFQLLPTLELFSLSSRDTYSLTQITNLLNPWWYSITMVFSDFFGNPAARNFWFVGTYIERVSYFGVIPFLFALAMGVSRSTKNIKFWSIVAIVSLLLSMDLVITRYIYLLPFPILSTTVPTRILCLFEFAGAVLAGYGLDSFIKGEGKRNFIIASVTGLVIAVIAWGFVLVGPHIKNAITVSDFSITKHNLILPTSFICIFALCTYSKYFIHYHNKPLFARVIVLVLFVATIGDLFYFFQKITPFSSTLFVYPHTSVISFVKQNAGINRFWGYGEGYIDANFQAYDQTYSPSGLDALHIKAYSELVSASVNGSMSDVSRDSANVSPNSDIGGLMATPYRERALDILGVKYILNKNSQIPGSGLYLDPMFSSNAFKLIWQDSPWQIYQNLQAVPRILLTNNYVVEDSSINVIHTLYNPQFNPTKTLVLTFDPRLPKSIPLRSRVKLMSYSPNFSTYQTNANEPTLLFLSDNNYPGWHASIDNVPANILTADYTFKAVEVPRGMHTVTFWYYPQSFSTGILASCIFLLAYVLGFWLSVKKAFKLL